VTAPAPLTALMSALALADDAETPASLLAALAADAASPHGAAAACAAAYPGAATRTFRFVQPVPVAPYLIGAFVLISEPHCFASLSHPY